MPDPASDLSARVQPGSVDVQTLRDLPRRPDDTIDLDRIQVGLGGTLLESVAGMPGGGRYSYVVAGIRGRFVAGAHSAALDLEDGGRVALSEDPFVALGTLLAEAGLGPDGDRDGLPPLTGGLVGAFSYDLGRAVEHVPSYASAQAPDDPWIDLVLADAVVAVDHDTEVATLIRRPFGATPRIDGSEVTLRAKQARVPPIPQPTIVRAASTLTHQEYLSAIDRVLGHIAAGDVFQVNLTQLLSAPWPGTGPQLYRALRAASPAPFGASHVTASGDALASISPETFLHASGRQVTTRPIKGTRPRDGDLLTDLALKQALAASSKDRAENVMVVDMERNDLGRVCVPGTVRVPDLLTIEGHPTVWQLVSTVTGELAEGVGYADLLRATFPCGSITGTPKVRAMEVIESLEPVRRSWYCGAIGFISVGAMSTAVAIRTAIVRDGTATYGAGGGVVADSDAEDEYAESLAKAVPFLTATTGDAFGGLR